jgi:hypothetical protein
MPLLEVLGLARPRSRLAPPVMPAAAVPPIAGGAQFQLGERRFESQRKELKADLVDSAGAKTAAQGDVSSRLTLKTRAEAQIARAAAALAGKGEADAKKSRADAQQVVDALDAHARKDAAKTAITDARAKLAASDAHAAKKEWPEATMRAMEGQLVAVWGRKLADDVEAFLKTRASVIAQVYGADRLLPPADLTAIKNLVVKADGLANGPPPDIAAARKAVEDIRAGASAIYKRSVDDVKARLATIDALGVDAKAAVAGDLAKARPLVAEADAAFAADEWARSLAASLAALDFLAPSERVGARRQAFDTQRATTLAQIANVRAKDAIKAHAAELDARVADADKLADPKTQQYEQATKALEDVATRAGVWLSVAPSIEQANTLRDAALKDLAALDAGPATAATQALRDAARAKLADAANTATLMAGGNDPARGAQTLLATTRRAADDVAQAKALAASLGPALAADAAATKGGSSAALKKALDALRADLKKASAAQPPPQADAPLKRAEAAAADGDAALARKDTAAAAGALKKAAAALGEARAAMVESDQAAALLTAVEARRTALRALPNALKLKVGLDALDRALDAARKASGADAIPKVRGADDAATVVENADTDRKAFDVEATAVYNLISALTDPKVKADLVQRADAAKARADALKFADATKAMLEVRTRAGKARVAALATVKPPDAGTIASLARLADELARQGAGADVDKMIEKLPAGTDPRTAAAIAQGRFGIAFEADAGAAPAQELASVQAICKMLAKVPQDVRGNASLKRLRHTDNPPPEAGGVYDQATATMSLNGRPKAQDQQFGAKLLAPAGPPGPPGSPPPPMVRQLPDVDPKFAPANQDPVDVLDWSSLHEVGHGLDDKHKYMLQNQSSPDHGGWTSYGSNVQPIADVVGRHFGFDTTPEQRKYVRDALMSLPPTEPPAPDRKVDWAKRKKDFDDWLAIATSENVYRRQADCEKIRIGTLIYHEAYPRQWVSYLAAARKQGLTGYQFRHPGEWFSELYAGYKSGKLRKGHPALDWLARLSP